MPFISYSQNREDVVLHRVFSNKPRGFYIDVGANDPMDASVTKGLYELGWQGINIEPVQSVFERLQADRPRDVNLNVGISNCSKTISFFECPSPTTLSTFSEVEAEHRAELSASFTSAARFPSPPSLMCVRCTSEVRLIFYPSTPKIWSAKSLKAMTGRVGARRYS